MSTGRRLWLKIASMAPSALVLPPLCAQGQSDAAPFTIVAARMRSAALAQVNTSHAAHLIRAERVAGFWNDIDYSDRSPGHWKPLAHFERLRVLAAAFSNPTHTLSGAPEVRRAVLSGVQAWLNRPSVSDNWWHNTIGLQMPLVTILMLMRAEVPSELMKRALGLLSGPDEVPLGRATGQNLIWYAQQQLARGVLGESYSDAAHASQRLQQVIAFTTDEGMQTDFSFHQHEAQLYSGGYGLVFLLDSARIAALVAGTPWAYAPERLDLLADYALLGVTPLVRGSWLDWGARGREFTRDEKTPRTHLLRDAAATLMPLTPSRSKPLAELIAALAANKVDPAPTGNRHFWRSDFMVHSRPLGYVSIKMVSSRTVGTESGNGENLLGYWLPFGVTYIVRQGDEYDGLPPVWDWSAIPGLTAPQEVPPLIGYQRHTESFVGGVSDGTSGLAAMHVNKLQTRANRAWFLHGDLMLALGAGIVSDHPSALRTTLNQTRWRGEVQTDSGPLRDEPGRIELTDRKWVWHDGVTYLLLNATGASLKLEKRQFDVNRINPALGPQSGTARVFELSLNHGAKPRDASYAYGVWLGAAQPAAVSNAPAASVLANDGDLQAVQFAQGEVIQCVWHRAGALALDVEQSLTVDQPCMLMLRAGRGGWKVWASDPSREGRAVTIELHSGNRRIAGTTLELHGLSAGSRPQAEGHLRNSG